MPPERSDRELGRLAEREAIFYWLMAEANRFKDLGDKPGSPLGLKVPLWEKHRILEVLAHTIRDGDHINGLRLPTHGADPSE